MIPLTQGEFAIIDTADAALVEGFHWTVNRCPERPPYAVRRTINKTIYLHRHILGSPPQIRVDHKNLNSLDCRRSNLRVATPGQNMMNVNKRSANPNRYKGVRLRHDGKAWCARVQFQGKGIHLGSFPTEIEAARAYDDAARKLFGEFALTNLPDIHRSAA